MNIIDAGPTINITFECDLEAHTFKLIDCSPVEVSTYFPPGAVFASELELDWYTGTAQPAEGWATLTIVPAVAGDSMSSEYSTTSGVTVASEGAVFNVHFSGVGTPEAKFMVWNPTTTRVTGTRPTLILLPKPGTSPTRNKFETATDIKSTTNLEPTPTSDNQVKVST